jgi:hypothetical protein
LPIDVLAEKPKTGNTHRYLSVPVEDVGEGWKRAGTVGQEVYGASAPFIIATRHCHTVPNEEFTIHCNYPVGGLEIDRNELGGSAKFKFRGDPRFEAAIRIVAHNFTPIPKFEVSRVDGKARSPVEGKLSPLGYYEYVLPGDAEVEVKWDKKELFIGQTPVPKAAKPKAKRTRIPHKTNGAKVRAKSKAR